MSKWKMVKLGDVCKFINGDRGKNYPSGKDIVENGIPFINAGHLVNNEISFSSMNYITEDKYNQLGSGKIQKGDFLYCLRGSLGKHAIVENLEKGAVASSLVILRPTNIDVHYLSYCMDSPSISTQLQQANNGSSQPNLSANSVKQYIVPLPPLEEQKRIADILDKASNLIDLRKQQLEKMDLLIKSKFIDMFGDPVTNPKGWDMKKISDVCIINPRKTELGSIPDDLEVSFIPMASVSEKGDIRTNEIKKYSEVKTGFTYFHEGDVLFAKITPCMENGKGAIAINLKNLIGFGSTEFHVIRPLENITNSEWIFNLICFKWLREDAEKNMTGSAGQRRVPASYFEKCKVSVPPIELQNQFAKFVEQVEKQKAVMQQSLEKMETNYKALMQEYFG